MAERRGLRRILVEKLREGDHLEDSGIDGRVILRWLFKEWDVGPKNWIDLDQDSDRWLVLVNVVMNLRVP
jgi:hypothetical protein